MLITRSTIYKVIGVLILMTIVEFLLFSWVLSSLAGGEIIGLEYAFDNSYIFFVFAAAFCALVIMLTGLDRRKKAKPEYTLLRLSITEKQIFLWHSLYNFLCFLLFLLLQTLVVMGLCQYYMDSGIDPTVSVQTVFLAFYRNAFLHSLLPLDNPFNMAGNVFLALAMGICCARSTVLQRCGKGSGIMIFTIYMGIRTFIRETDENINKLLLWVVVIVVLIEAGIYLFRKEAADEE